MILQVSYKSSSIICTANDTISSAFPFEQHAKPLTVYLPMIALSNNQHNSSTNNCSKKCQLPNHDLASLLQIQAALYATANDRISSAFPFKQHANPLTIYLRMIAHSINQHNSSTNNCSKKCQLPNNDLASLLQIKQHYIRLQMTQLVQNFHSNSMQILSQYICA